MVLEIASVQNVLKERFTLHLTDRPIRVVREEYITLFSLKSVHVRTGLRVQGTSKHRNVVIC